MAGRQEEWLLSAGGTICHCAVMNRATETSCQTVNGSGQLFLLQPVSVFGPIG